MLNSAALILILAIKCIDSKIPALMCQERKYKLIVKLVYKHPYFFSFLFFFFLFFSLSVSFMFFFCLLFSFHLFGEGNFISVVVSIKIVLLNKQTILRIFEKNSFIGKHNWITSIKKSINKKEIFRFNKAQQIDFTSLNLCVTFSLLLSPPSTKNQFQRTSDGINLELYHTLVCLIKKK